MTLSLSLSPSLSLSFSPSLSLSLSPSLPLGGRGRGPLLLVCGGDEEGLLHLGGLGRLLLADAHRHLLALAQRQTQPHLPPTSDANGSLLSAVQRQEALTRPGSRQEMSPPNPPSLPAGASRLGRRRLARRGVFNRGRVAGPSRQACAPLVQQAKQRLKRLSRIAHSRRKLATRCTTREACAAAADALACQRSLSRLESSTRR